MATKLARDLEPGDKVQMADGRTLTVGRIGKGFSPGTILITWKEYVLPDFSCVPKSETVFLG